LVEAWLQYLGASIVVFAGGWTLVRFGDAIGEQTGLGRVWAGVILLATATSLPELVTGITAVRGLDSPNLAVGGAFGANSLNLLVIAVLGIKWHGILRDPTVETRQMGSAGVILLLMAGGILILGREELGVPSWIIRVLPITMIVAYVITVLWTIGQLGSVLRSFRRSGRSTTSTDGSAGPGFSFGRPSAPLMKNIGGYLFAVGIVTVGGIWLAIAADGVSDAMGWSSSFVGAQFLPISTTLPEFSVALASLRIGAPDLALSNLLGSNMFNIGIVLSADSLAYTKGALFTDVSSIHLIATAAGLAMTLILIPGLVSSSRPFARTVGLKTVTKIGVYASMSSLIFVFS
jgi:cation:H+ antiporter